MNTAPPPVVLLAVYNGEDFLAEQLDTVLAQSTEVDILIRDDGSDDNSQCIIQDYCTQYSNITALTNTSPRQGVKANFSALLHAALEHDYHYFLFCDQDDLWLDSKVSELLAVAKTEENPNLPFLIHSDLRVVDQNQQQLSQSFAEYQGLAPENVTLERLFVENVVTGCATMINRPLAELATPIPEVAIMHDWWLALLAKTTGKLHWYEKPLVNYRQHQKNTLAAQQASLNKSLGLLQQKQKWGLTRYYEQAAVLKKTIGESAKSQDSELLNQFLESRYQSGLKRVVFFYKNGIKKQNVFKHTLLLLTALFISEGMLGNPHKL